MIARECRSIARESMDDGPIMLCAGAALAVTEATVTGRGTTKR